MKARKASTRHIREPTEKNIYAAEFDEIDHLFEVEELSDQLQVEGSRTYQCFRCLSKENMYGWNMRRG